MQARTRDIRGAARARKSSREILGAQDATENNESGMAGPNSIVLYSTVPHLKLMVCSRFVKEHYFWCSEQFDGAAGGSSTPWAPRAPTSNPKDIYIALRKAVRGNDRHDRVITDRRATLKHLAVTWHTDTRIDEAERDEIIYLADQSPYDDWRPKLCVIPVALVSSRCKLVPPKDRASTGLEWTVASLKDGEFDVIELPDA